MEDYAMFCRQCQEAAHGTGCTTVGVCGKTPELAHLQDLLLYVLKGLASYAVPAREYGVLPEETAYYRDFASALPKDTVILTAGCAKYKYNKLDLGEIDGIPRVLDAGQCNDSYSLAVLALKLKEAFWLTDINELPISYNLSWYEQKAVIVLLALLYLGVKNIHLGPTLPAFLSPNVANILANTFGIAGIDTVERDMAVFLGA